MIIFTCPKCGADLSPEVLTMMPPITVFRCYKCGYRAEEKSWMAVVRIPYREKEEKDGEKAD